MGCYTCKTLRIHVYFPSLTTILIQFEIHHKMVIDNYCTFFVSKLKFVKIFNIGFNLHHCHWFSCGKNISTCSHALLFGKILLKIMKFMALTQFLYNKTEGVTTVYFVINYSVSKFSNTFWLFKFCFSSDLSYWILSFV